MGIVSSSLIIFFALSNIVNMQLFSNEIENTDLNIIDDFSDNDTKIKAIPKETISDEIEISGPVTKVVDGDTIDVNDIRIRLALVDTPERGEPGFKEATDFVKKLCQNKDAQVDIDDGQRGGDRYGREIGVVYCDNVNINNELIQNSLGLIDTRFCDNSEFSDEEWAKSCR
ncbi:MAG: thermonuclease family protein [Nitrososphaeraceae archaeon]